MLQRITTDNATLNRTEGVIASNDGCDFLQYLREKKMILTLSHDEMSAYCTRLHDANAFFKYSRR